MKHVYSEDFKYRDCSFDSSLYVMPVEIRELQADLENRIPVEWRQVGMTVAPARCHYKRGYY